MPISEVLQKGSLNPAFLKDSRTDLSTTTSTVIVDIFTF